MQYLIRERQLATECHAVGTLGSTSVIAFEFSMLHTEAVSATHVEF